MRHSLLLLFNSVKEAWSLTKLIYPVLFTLYLVGQSSIKSLVIKTWYVIFDDSYLAAKKKVGEAKTDYFKDLCCCNYICFQKPSHQYCQSWNFNLLYRVCIQVQRYYNYIRLLHTNNIHLGKMNIISFPPLLEVSVKNWPLHVLLVNCTAPTHTKIFLDSNYMREDHQSRYSSVVLRRIHWVLRCLGGTHA